MCGAPELTRIELAVLGRPTAGHLAADQASAGHPAAADRASAARPAAADHPAADHLAGQASDLDSDSSFFPLQYWFATSIARFPWQESIRGQCIRSRSHIEAMFLELVPTFRVPFCNKENRRWDAICFCGCLGCRFRFWCSSGFLVVFTRRMIEAAKLPRSQGGAAGARL
jgi:hypothetical protein